ncbi:hypothetical protein NPIL_76521 [Nephila pilipes]|uniref:Uncharacterized protein n=1 Tax=Nephila pilipes TaxID=299642 RepID=A0A8X6NJU9_NEPPI|nr:hypothetical protein NPIL_76521 [Nephila pilipes]
MKAFVCKILETVLQKFKIFEGGISCLKLSQSLIKLHLGNADTKETKEKILIYMRKSFEIFQYVGFFKFKIYYRKIVHV